MIHKDEISMNVVQNEPYLINKCCNILLIIIISIFITHSEINIQSRCCNIKHNPGADSQVSRPAADAKVIKKITFFFEKNVVGCTIFAERPTKLARLIVHASFTHI